MDKKILHIILGAIIVFGLLAGTIFLENYIIRWKESKRLKEEYEKSLEKFNSTFSEEEYYQTTLKEETTTENLQESESIATSTPSSPTTTSTTTTSTTTTSTTPVTEVPF
ncbi:MAG: hypothetical protein ACP5H7_00395 [Minisyncoccia bacterium]